jgi:predicted membrane protein
MNGTSTVLIVVGLFLVGGIISFVKQKMPKSLIVLLSIGAAMCLVAGVMRLEVWN